MGGSHSHDTGPPEPVPPQVRRAALIVLIPLLVATLAGLILLWPTADTPRLENPIHVAGTVTATAECNPPDAECVEVTFKVDQGADAGITGTMPTSAGLGLTTGTPVWLVAGEEGGYSLADVRRDRPLLLLAVITALAIIAMARWKGVAALAGLIVSVLLLIHFVVPALLTGTDPLAVAAVGSAAIAIATMGLAHGFSVRTSVALTGTLLALGLTAVLGAFFTGAASLTGATGDDALYLQATNSTVDLRGLLLAGLVIGALGVLDDVTITQAAAVWEVRAADPSTSGRALFAAGMRVGRDHVAATVNTLVLAYAGASLPLFLLLSMSTAPLSQALSIELVATEIVRTLVGTLGIVAAVPLTTAMAAWVLAQRGTPKL